MTATPEPVGPAAPPTPDAPPQTGDPEGYARPIEVVTILSVLALDQATKQIVRQTLPLHDTINLIPGLLDLTHVQNTGAAFGILNAAEFPFKPTAMMAIAAIALVAIAAYGVQLGLHERLARMGLALILGGALGNLVDRAIAGYVVDFVDVYWGTSHFWAFNVADAAISVGALLVVLDMIGLGRQHASHPV